MIRPTLPALTAALYALLAGGCILKPDDRTAGVDEFPNSIYARVNTFLDEGKKSESIAPVPSLADSLIGQPGFNLAAGKSGAGKTAAARIAAAGGGASAAGARADGMPGLFLAPVDSGCTSGTLTVHSPSPSSTPDKATDNTIVVCADANAFDTVERNETLIKINSETAYGNGREETAEISDADGDGILNPIAGRESKANITFTALQDGILEKALLVVGPGPDNDFDTEADNLVYAASWSRTRGTDTLGSAVYTDADSDGVAIDNGKPSVVDLVLYEKGPSKDHPDALWSRAEMRQVVRYKIEAKEVRRVRFETENGSGRHDVGEILNLDGGIHFSMGDTVQAHFLSVGTAASDTLDTSDVHLTMSLGSDFDSKSDDSVYALDVVSVKKLGDERRAHFSFVSDNPIPSGKDPQSGTLSMGVRYRDSTSLEVEGGMSADRLDVTVKDRKDARLHVVWDRQGHGITLEKLP